MTTSQFRKDFKTLDRSEIYWQQISYPYPLIWETAETTNLTFYALLQPFKGIVSNSADTPDTSVLRTLVVDSIVP